MLDLHLLDKVAGGKNRDVYLVPPGHLSLANNTIPLVLKVPRYSERDQKQSGLKKQLQRLVPSSTTRVISNEATYLQNLAKRIKDETANVPIPAFYGFAETTDGPGALWEAICDANGDLAPTLEDIKQADAMKTAIGPLNAFARFCYDQNIVGPDINDRNMVLALRDGVPTIFLIDGFGDHRLVSTRSLFSNRNKASLDARFQKVARKTKLNFDIDTKRFSARRRRDK